MTEAQTLTGGASAGKLRGVMSKKRSKKIKKEKMLEVKDVAKRLNAGESSVRYWAGKGKFQGAYKEPSPRGSYWLIPESSLEDFEKSNAGFPLGAKRKGSKK